MVLSSLVTYTSNHSVPSARYRFPEDDILMNFAPAVLHSTICSSTGQLLSKSAIFTTSSWNANLRNAALVSPNMLFRWPPHLSQYVSRFINVATHLSSHLSNTTELCTGFSRGSTSTMQSTLVVGGRNICINPLKIVISTQPWFDDPH